MSSKNPSAGPTAEQSPPPLPAFEAMPSRGRAALRLSGIAAVLVLIGALLLIAALALWMHHGTAIFFDLMAAGIAYCL